MAQLYRDHTKSYEHKKLMGFVRFDSLVWVELEYVNNPEVGGA